MIPIILHTHSEYSFLWNVAIQLLQKHVPFGYKIYWFSDTLLDFTLPENFIFCKYDPKLVWSARFGTYIEMIDSDYILYIQEDWLLTYNIDSEKVEYILKYMRDNSIDFIMSYSRGHEQFIEKSEYENYDFIKIRGHYFQPAIWSKELFTKIINLNIQMNQNESGAAFDITVNSNCYCIRYTKSRDVSIPTFYFPHMHAICAGKWTFIRYPQLKEMVESYGIDTTTRGVCTNWITDYQ